VRDIKAAQHREERIKKRLQRKKRRYETKVIPTPFGAHVGKPDNQTKQTHLRI
jgi:hypothetical protein